MSSRNVTTTSTYFKTATVPASFPRDDSTSLALPSDKTMLSGGTLGQQRVTEQVYSTLKRNKTTQRTESNSSKESSTQQNGFSFKMSPTTPTGSGFFSSNVNGNQYSTYSSKKQFYQQNSLPAMKYHNNSMGFSKRQFSCNSQRESQFSPTSPVNGFQTYKTMTTSRSEPDIPQIAKSPTLLDYQNKRHSAYRGMGMYMTMPYVNQTQGQTTANKFNSHQTTVDSGGMAVSKLTLREAVDCLGQRDENLQYCGASFIQHFSFQEDKTKQKVYSLGGIPKLVDLLSSKSPEVQQAASGALRNLVFKCQTNKMEVKRNNGIYEALKLLRQTDCPEIQKQLTGLLWNLSSADELKPELVRDALPVLTEKVVVPFAGCSEEDVQLNSSLDSEIFYNATGCLRNLSSANKSDRDAMRSCRGLIDSLVSYVQVCMSADRPDDKSVENCVCILHNLSYQLEQEAPAQFSQISSLASSPTRDLSTNDSSSMGCFSPRSSQISQENSFAPPILEDSNPKGMGWLFNSKTMQTYLSLMGKSKKDATLEACAGALQNITANNGIVSNVMSQTIVQKLNGLPEVSRLLKSSNPGVQKTAMSLLGNLSRNPSLQNVMSRQILPDITQVLTSGAHNTACSDDMMAAACHTIRNLVVSNPESAKGVMGNSVLSTLCDLSRNGYSPKSSKAAAILLYDLWGQKELQSFFKKQGVNKNIFVNDITNSAYKTLQGVM
ncbi:plakophilin-1-like [Polyodon spathula]|uniref:plakophilin-1-like n=1 Tax=Polyodon spathula TaxID=7913 RepID=UPI001B7F6A98|nr:plakophilin-1-like [Polyodon spathula]